MQHTLPRFFDLPGGKVGVLDRQWRQRIVEPGDAIAVERDELVDEHAAGPAIGSDVMQCQQHHMVRVGQANQHAAQHEVS
ncbi:hypothetical protein [Xanthomonas sp. MLO165]|uniref:hypothetical protein n=1 Tax=Xanthomonas sp. MLO165 TaxID=2081477 RepID=UPI00207BAD4E|nr:hypothetical protein [Xanthomonas sp. MLO165]